VLAELSNIRAALARSPSLTMTGHKTRSVFERYNIVSECDLFATRGNRWTAPSL
jgi:hypothetical protein